MSTKHELPEYPNILVVGAGYLGMPTAGAIGAGMVKICPNKVTLCDISVPRIAAVQRAMLTKAAVHRAMLTKDAEPEDPLGEPDLGWLLRLAGEKGMHAAVVLRDQLELCINNADIVIACIGTPPRGPYPDDNPVVECEPGAPSTGYGRLDTEPMCELAGLVFGLAKEHKKPKLFIVRSTIDPQTAAAIANVADRTDGFGMFAHVPEFLREGHAVGDTIGAKRFVIGSRSAYAAEVARKCVMHRSLVPGGRGVSYLHCLPEEAAMVKVFANTMLAYRIAFGTAVAALTAQIQGGDYARVLQGIGSDPRIGSAAMSPGLGPVGPCLIKDSALGSNLLDGMITAAAIFQVTQGIGMSIQSAIASRTGTCVLLGVGFKPDSKDWRNSHIPEMYLGLVTRYATAGVTDRSVVLCDDRLTDEDVQDLKAELKRLLLEDGIFIEPDIRNKLRDLPDEWSTLLLAQELEKPLIAAVIGIGPAHGAGRLVIDPYAMLNESAVLEIKERGFVYAGAGRGPGYPETPWEAQ